MCCLPISTHCSAICPPQLCVSVLGPPGMGRGGTVLAWTDGSLLRYIEQAEAEVVPSSRLVSLDSDLVMFKT